MSNKPILVIGGGPAGLEATRGIADLGYNAILVDKSDVLGGNPISANYAALTPDMRDAEEAMGEMVDTITDNGSKRLVYVWLALPIPYPLHFLWSICGFQN